MTEALKQQATPESHEQLSEKNALEGFIKNFKNIGEKYSENQRLNHNPEEVKIITLKQLKELQSILLKYQNDPIWKRYTDGFKTQIIKMEADIRNIITLLTEGTEKRFVLNAISEAYDYNSLLSFIPEGYKENGKLCNRVIKEAKNLNILSLMGNFLVKEGTVIPYFNNEDYKNNQEIITKALSKPGVILNMYEGIRANQDRQDLANNLDFIKTLNNVLIQEYPNVFGKIQDKKWYIEQGTISFDKISTLLDIIQYGTPDQKKYFIEMMNSAENGESEKALELYEQYFIWTNIGNNIIAFFENSALMSYSIQNTWKTLKDNTSNAARKLYNKLASIEDKDVLQGYLQYFKIPKKNLNALFSRLSDIESTSNNNIEDIVKIIGSLKIDPFFVQLFFIGLMVVEMDYGQSTKKEHKASNKGELYERIGKFYISKVDVAEEERDIKKTKEDNEGTIFYSVIKNSFPQAEGKNLDEKNARLNHLLEKFIDGGKISVESKEFKKELLNIFKGSEIGNKLENEALTAKEALAIVADAAKEGTKQIITNLKSIDTTFSEEKLDQLKKEDREKLLILINSDVNIDIKIDALRKHKITSKQFENEEQKISFLQNLQKYIKLQTASNFTESILTDKTKIAAFEAYWNGGSVEVFNETIEKRDQEIQQEKALQESSSKQGEKPNNRTYEFNQIDFSKTPFHEIISTKVGNISFSVRKDSGDTSTVLYKGMEISGIETKNLSEIPEMIQFIRDTGLDIFGSHISDILAIINNGQTKKGGKEQINLKDGLGSNEKHIILKSMADILIPGIDTSNKEKLEKNFKNIQKNGGMLEYLRQNKKEYITADNSININAFKNTLKRTV